MSESLSPTPSTSEFINLTEVTRELTYFNSKQSSYEQLIPISASLENYLQVVAHTGGVNFSWRFVKKLFLAKMEQVLTEFIKQNHCGHSSPDYEVEKMDLLTKWDQMTRAPVTIQRLAELITSPAAQAQYTSVVKLLRALKKNILMQERSVQMEEVERKKPVTSKIKELGDKIAQLQDEKAKLQDMANKTIKTEERGRLELAKAKKEVSAIKEEKDELEERLDACEKQRSELSSIVDALKSQLKNAESLQLEQMGKNQSQSSSADKSEESITETVTATGGTSAQRKSTVAPQAHIQPTRHAPAQTAEMVVRPTSDVRATPQNDAQPKPIISSVIPRTSAINKDNRKNDDLTMVQPRPISPSPMAGPSRPVEPTSAPGPCKRKKIGEGPAAKKATAEQSAPEVKKTRSCGSGSIVPQKPTHFRCSWASCEYYAYTEQKIESHKKSVHFRPPSTDDEPQCQ